ncbi:polyprenyl synthetase family protein [Nonomuraea aurantiaca]|jgi:geranylgeranyl pyrophosphate synthase|uniref:polyprenyl synthetase family protein n=1 Tax=Nonomuraea aurantiaca TaxID=2878562 RepID=UPI001CD94732|nr:polyprenyl synthetase family protein [Nonomuraea aurantiaca]MCA2226570.1 polyprenyl synthetase family protein [Nonomuraea aurantiaca]
MPEATAATAYSAQVQDRLRGLVAGLPRPARDLVTGFVDRPGKRLRSTLLGAAARCGPHDRERVVRLGAVVELLHLASLVHDDVIDRAPTRRGAPAAHLVAGPELAVLAGLSCLALAGTEAADLGTGPNRLISAAVAHLAQGELLDVERAFDTTYTLADYDELVERKTGALFRLCCVLGAAEARLGPPRAEALAAFGRQLGVAFQILDDCLDLAGPATDSGKPAGTDHLLGLFGAPTLCALRDAPSGELAALLLDPALTAADLPRVRTLVIAYGGMSAAHDLARAAYDESLAALAPLGGLGDGGAGRQALLSVATSLWREAPC